MRIIEQARAMHRGELGLGQTFWLWFLAPLWLMRLIVILVMPKGPPDAVIAIQSAALTIIWLVADLAWFLYSGMGVWRCAGRNPGFWGIAARVVIFLNMAYLVLTFLGTGIALIDDGLRALWPIQRR